MLNLDTHILVHALNGELTVKEREILKPGTWGISCIVLWELAMLRRNGRIGIDVNNQDFDSVLSRIKIWPLDLTVARAIVRHDFRSDPADEIIAATSVAVGVPLVTRDRKILASKVVPFALT